MARWRITQKIMLPKPLGYPINSVTVATTMKYKMNHEIIDKWAMEYGKASKKEKGGMLDILESVTKMPRKSLIRYLNRPKKQWLKNEKRGQQPAPRGRPRRYSAEAEAALAFIWKAYDYPCAERLKHELAEAVRIFRRDHMWHYSDAATDSLIGMSLSSLKLRTIAMAKKRGLLRGPSTTKQSDIRQAVPVFEVDWSQRGVGYGQIDTVVHSGPKLMGSMVYTVNYVDAATYWQEPIAQLNKSESATLASMQLLQERLPFKLRGLHPDTGSEFINWLAKSWCDEQGIELTRSKPGRHNDNCYIEQRNNVVVRKYLGYERFDCREAVGAMNELYDVLRLYVNFFQPTYKLIGKVSYRSLGIERKGSRRIYDQPATPYARLNSLPDGMIDEKTKQELQALYESLNPLTLLTRIETLTIKLRKVQEKQGYHY